VATIKTSTAAYKPTSTVSDANLAVALELAAAGVIVFPALVTWNATTKKLDKRPAISGWREAASTDAEQIKQWWATFPDAVPGIELGRSNLFVVDLDRHPGGADGVAAFKTFRNDNPVPRCPTTKTPSGGYHLYFRQPDSEPLGNRTGTLPRGIDCRGGGGWTVAPGAVFEKWRWGNTVDLKAAPAVPDWILSAIRARKIDGDFSAAGTSQEATGKRERAWAEAALRSEANKLAATERGRRNTTLNTAAFRLGGMVARSWIGQHTVEGALLDACLSNRLVQDDGRQAVLATIKSGIEAGVQSPHGDLPDRERNPSEAPSEREPAKRGTTWRDGMVTARELQTKQFKPVRIILPEVIPEGVTLLAGKPKVGKSWFALDVCVAVAAHRFVLGDKQPVQGDALYLALEDNERRLHNRMHKVMQLEAWPETLEMHTEWRRVDQGGLDDIKEWCEAHPARRLIWIDTLPKIRPIPGRNEPPYMADYRAIEGLQKLAGEYQVGIVVNCHLRKAPSEDDPFDEVSGTLGLSGAADTIIVMKRHAGKAKVYLRGRDIEEAEFAAEFNKQTCRWRFVGKADEVFRSEQRQAIATALKESGRPMSVSEVMAATERRDRHSTEALLAKMERAGEVKHVGRGQWAHPDPTESVGIVGKERSDSGNGRQALSNTEEISAAESQRKTQRKHNAGETVVIPVVIPESANPLADKEKPAESQHHNDHNGSERVTTNGFRPPRGNGWHLAGDKPQGQAGCQVWLKEVWPPAISAGPDDDVFDIDLSWRQ
jgi:Bifunctional DNA primase/polymerase, N-terminal/AAA domain